MCLDKIEKLAHEMPEAAIGYKLVITTDHNRDLYVPLNFSRLGFDGIRYISRGVALGQGWAMSDNEDQITYLRGVHGWTSPIDYKFSLNFTGPYFQDRLRLVRCLFRGPIATGTETILSRQFEVIVYREMTILEEVEDRK